MWTVPWNHVSSSMCLLSMWTRFILDVSVNRCKKGCVCKMGWFRHPSLRTCASLRPCEVARCHAMVLCLHTHTLSCSLELWQVATFPWWETEAVGIYKFLSLPSLWYICAIIFHFSQIIYGKLLAPPQTIIAVPLSGCVAHVQTVDRPMATFKNHSIFSRIGWNF